MADAVTTQTLIGGSKRSVIKFTNVSDASGESGVVKVDYSALGFEQYPKIMKCWYMTSGMAVDIYFDATANVLALSLPTDSSDSLDFSCFGGIQNNAGSGVTGDILFTTRGAGAADTYVIILEVEHS